MKYKLKRPKGWISSTIKDICDLINGRAFKPSDWSTRGLPIIRIQNLNNPDSKYNYCDFEVDQKFIVEEEQLLFAWSGTPRTSFGSHIWRGGKAVLNQHIFKIVINENLINKRFLMITLNQRVSEYIEKAHGTAGLAHITKKKFEESLVLLPPFNEQKEIVSRIEKLFEKLDAGVEELEKIKKQLKRYRQAVLKAAFSGELTKEWREKKRKEEPEQFHKEQKKLGKNEIDDTEVPHLPEGWVLGIIDDISKLKQYGTSEKATSELNGIPVVRMGNIQDGVIVYDKLKYFPKEWAEKDKYKLYDGDILFNRTNSAELVGKTAVVKSSYPQSVFASYLIRIKIKDKMYFPEILSFFINSFLGRKYISSVISQQVGQANVNSKKLGKMPIPMIPINEQEKLLEEIKRRFQMGDEIENVVDESLEKTRKLRQSILREAFNGNLTKKWREKHPELITGENSAQALLVKIKKDQF